MTGRRFGIEEEFLLVDPETGVPAADAGNVLGDPTLAARGVEKELKQEQIETDTAPVCTLADARAEVVRLRSAAAEAAAESDVRLAALGTSPLPVESSTTPVARYEQMTSLYQLTAAEQLTCGMHVHVETASPEEAVGALDRIRPWLPVVLALSANSPFWQGQHTGYQSFRSQAWSRWPTAGPTDVFGSLDAYRGVVAAAVQTEAIVDDGMIYFDARLGRGLPTLEVRVADVCGDLEDAVLVAALIRALVDTGARSWLAGEPPDPVRAEVLRLATWRASRSGLTDALVDPRTGLPADAWDVVWALRQHVGDSLDDAGDAAEVDDGLARLRATGTGSVAQHISYARRHDLADVVRDAVARTAPDT